MDKDTIRLAMRNITKQIQIKYNTEYIYVPTRRTLPCRWNTKDKRYKKIPLHVLNEVIDFVLDNTLIKTLQGGLMRQEKGIPMGDPHSPAMCIGTCAWMEQEWMSTLSENTKEYFKCGRYMDDVLLMSVQHKNFDQDRLIDDMSKSDCYLPPLKLEAARQDTFLETTFEITRKNTIRHWLKNDNDIAKPPKIWRYAHFQSYMAFAQKKRIMVACMRKVHKMASDAHALHASAVKKLSEFWHLDYPDKLLWNVCTYMGVQTRIKTWFDIRDNFQYVTKNPALRVENRTVQRPVMNHL